MLATPTTSSAALELAPLHIALYGCLVVTRTPHRIEFAPVRANELAHLRRIYSGIYSARAYVMSAIENAALITVFLSVLGLPFVLCVRQIVKEW
jgi:hypothetical protein